MKHVREDFDLEDRGADKVDELFNEVTTLLGSEEWDSNSCNITMEKLLGLVRKLWTTGEGFVFRCETAIKDCMDLSKDVSKTKDRIDLKALRKLEQELGNDSEIEAAWQEMSKVRGLF